MEEKVIISKGQFEEYLKLKKVFENRDKERQNVDSNLDNQEVLADRELLAEDWLSSEDEEAWKDL